MTCTWRALLIREPRVSRRELAGSGGRFLLGQFEQDPGGRLGMHEGDAPAAGARARPLIDEAKPRRATARERGVEVGHAIAEMMNAGPAGGEELGHGAR